MSCGICGTTFSEDSCDDAHQPRAKILACLHIICTDCLAPLIQVFPDEKAIVTVCPLCSTPTVKSLPSEFVHETEENNTLTRCSSDDSDMSVSKIDTTPTQYYPNQVESTQDGEQNLDTSVYSDLPDELLDMYNEGDEAPSYEEIYFQKEHINDSSELDHDGDTHSEDHQSQSMHSDTGNSSTRESVVHRNSELVALAHWTLVFIDFIIILSVCIYRFIGESIFADNSVIQIRASAETQTMVCALLLTHLLLQEMPSSSLFTGYHNIAEESGATVEGDQIINVLLVVADVAAVVALLSAAVGSTVTLVCQIIAQEVIAYLQIPSLSTADIVMAASAIALISSALYHALFETSPPESTYSPRKAKRSATPSHTPAATPSSAPPSPSVPKSRDPYTPNVAHTKQDVRYSSPEPRKELSVNSAAVGTAGMFAYTSVSPKLTPMDNPLRKASIRLPSRARFAATGASADIEYADIYGTSTSQASKVRSASPSLEELLQQAVLDDFTAQEEAQLLAEREAQYAAVQAALLAEHNAAQEASRLQAQRDEQRAAHLAAEQATRQLLAQAAALASAQAIADALRQAEERAAQELAEALRAELERAEEEKAVSLASERLAKQLARSVRPAVLSPPRSIHRADRHTPTDSEEHGMSAARLISPRKPSELSNTGLESSWGEASPPMRTASPVPHESAASRLFASVDENTAVPCDVSGTMRPLSPKMDDVAADITAVSALCCHTVDVAENAADDTAEESEVVQTSPVGQARPAVATHVPTAAYSPLQSFPQDSIASMALSPPVSPQHDDALSSAAPAIDPFTMTVPAANAVITDAVDLGVSISATDLPAAGSAPAQAAADASADAEFDPRVVPMQRQLGGTLLVAADSFFDLRDSAIAAVEAPVQALDRELPLPLEESPFPSLDAAADIDADVPQEMSEGTLISDVPAAEDKPSAFVEASKVDSQVVEKLSPAAKSVAGANGPVEVENKGADLAEETTQKPDSPSRSKFHVINASKRKKGLRKFKSMHAYSPPTSSPAKPSQFATTPPASSNKLNSKGKSSEKSMSKSWSESAPDVFSASNGAGGVLKRHNSTQSVVSKDGSLGTISSYSTMGGSSLNSSYNNINSVYAGAPTSAQKMMSKSAMVTATDGTESVTGSVASGGSQSRRSNTSPQSVRAARQAAADISTPKSKTSSATKLATPPVSLPKPELRSPSSFAYLSIYELKKHMPNDVNSAKSTPNRPAKKVLPAQAELDTSALEASVDLVDCMRTRSGEEASCSGTLFTGAEGRAVLPAPRRENGNRVAARRYSDDYDSESSDTSGGSSGAENDSEAEEPVVRAPSRNRGATGAAAGVDSAAVGHGASRPHGLQQVVPEPISFMPQPLPSPDLFHRETRDSGLASWIALQSYTEPPSPAFTSVTHNDFPDSSPVHSMQQQLRAGNSDHSLKAVAPDVPSATAPTALASDSIANDALGVAASEEEEQKGVGSETTTGALGALPLECENDVDSPFTTESAIAASTGAAVEVPELPSVTKDEQAVSSVMSQPSTASFVRHVASAEHDVGVGESTQDEPVASADEQDELVDSAASNDTCAANADMNVAAEVVCVHEDNMTLSRAEKPAEMVLDVDNPPIVAEDAVGEQIVDEATPVSQVQTGDERPEHDSPVDEASTVASATAVGTEETSPLPGESVAETMDDAVDDQSEAQEGAAPADDSALLLLNLSGVPSDLANQVQEDERAPSADDTSAEFSAAAELPQCLSASAGNPVSNDATSVLDHTNDAVTTSNDLRDGSAHAPAPASAAATVAADEEQEPQEVFVSTSASAPPETHFEDVYDEVQNDVPCEGVVIAESVQTTEQDVGECTIVHEACADEVISLPGAEALPSLVEIPPSEAAVPTSEPRDRVEKAPVPVPTTKHHISADIDTALANETSTEIPSPMESPDTMVTTYRDDIDAPETPGDHRMRIDVSISPDAMSQITAPSPAPLSILSLSQLAAPTPSPLKQSPMYMNLPISPYYNVTESSNGPPSRGSASNASFTAGSTGSRSKSNIRASIEERVYARMRRNSMNNLLPGSANSREGIRSAEPSPSNGPIISDKAVVATLNTPEEVDRFEHEMHALYRDYLPDSGAASVQRDTVSQSVGSSRSASQGRLSVSPLDPSSRQISPKPVVEMVTTGTSPIRVLQKQIEPTKQETVAALSEAVPAVPVVVPIVAPTVAPIVAPAVLNVHEELHEDTTEGASLYMRSNSVASLTAMRTASNVSNQTSVLAAITAEAGGEASTSPTRSHDRTKAALHRGSTVATMSSPGRATTVRPGSMFLKSPDIHQSTNSTPTKHSAVPAVISKVTVLAGIGKGKVSPVSGSVTGSVTPNSMKRSSTAAAGSSTVMAMRSVGTVGSVGTAGSAHSVSSTVSGTPKSLSRAASSLDCVADTMDTSSCYVVMVHMNQQLTSHRCVGKIAKCISSVVSKCQQRQCPVAVAIHTPHSPSNVLYWLYAVPNTRTSASVSSLAAAFQSPVSPLSASGGSVGSANSPDGPAVEYVIKAKNKPCFLLPKRGDSMADIQLTERMYRGAVSGLVSSESSAVTHLHSHHVDGDLKAGFEEHLLNLRAEIKLALGAFTGTTDVVVVCDSQSWPFYAPPELTTLSNALTKWSTFRSKVPYLQFHFVAINTLSSSASTASLLSGK